MARRRPPPQGPGNLGDYERIANESYRTFRRLDRRMQLVVLAALLLGGIIAAAIYFQTRAKEEASQLPAQAPPAQQPAPAQTRSESPPAPSEVAPAASPHMLLGNPSGATTDPGNKTNYLMVKPYYALAYNDTTGTPNWVSWRVTVADLGDAPRKRVFDPDTSLPAGFYRVTHKDYSNSGFDRGHLCPHSDRAATEEMSFATFVMTNIIPQAPNVNQKAWANLEELCRALVRLGNHLYIIAGPIGRGGTGASGHAETIAGGHVTVPAECWKVVVVVPEACGDDDEAKISSDTRVITVIMPNDNTAVGEAWAGFRTTPAEVERRTGYHMFDRLREEVAASFRDKVDAGETGEAVPIRRRR